MSDGTLSSWLFSMVEPVVKKGLAAVGLGWITFEGTTTILDQIRTHFMQSWGAMAPTVYDLIQLAGFLDAIGIILGAMATIAGLASMSKLGRMLA